MPGKGLQRGDREGFRTQFARGRARVLCQLARGWCSADSGLPPNCHVHCSHQRWTHQLLPRKFRRVAWRVESGADPAKWSRSLSTGKSGGKRIFPSVPRAGTGAEGRARRRLNSVLAAHDHARGSVLVRTLEVLALSDVAATFTTLAPRRFSIKGRKSKSPPGRTKRDKDGVPSEFSSPVGAGYLLRSQALERETASFHRPRRD